MSDASDIRQYKQNLREERNSAALYESMAAAESNPSVAEIYRRLAETERKHAAGAAVPPDSMGWRTRTLRWLAHRFGPAVVLPTLAAIETGAGAGYRGQKGAEVEAMAAQEQSHARVFGALVRSGGMEGRAVAKMEGRHRSTGGNALRAGVLGANDGLVSCFSLVMGVAGAEMSSKSILVTGLAGMLAGAISMALGEWLSVQSSRELYGHQMDIEKAELQSAPEEEKEELALIYQAKGISPEEAMRLAERIISDPASALDTLAREELGIDPDELGGSAWEAAITSFILFAAGAIIPVIPYFFTGGMTAVVWSVACSAVGLFGIGGAITLVTGRPVLWSGFRQVLFGLAAAAVTFGIGHLIGVQIGG